MREWLERFKGWLILLAFLVAFGAGLAGWATVPKDVKKLDEKVKKNGKAIVTQQVALEQYVAVNEEYKRQQMEQNKLLIELIKMRKDGNN